MLLALQDSALVEAAGQEEKEKGSFETGKGTGRPNENENVVAGKLNIIISSLCDCDWGVDWELGHLGNARLAESI